MATDEISISVRQEVYDLLNGLKHDGESISDAILRLTGHGASDFSDLIGIGTDLDIEWADILKGREASPIE